MSYASGRLNFKNWLKIILIFEKIYVNFIHFVFQKIKIFSKKDLNFKLENARNQYKNNIFNTEELKQLADPEETEGHDFTFSTEKQQLGDSYSDQIAGSIESALKRIPIDSTQKKLKTNLHSSSSSPEIIVSISKAPLDTTKKNQKHNNNDKICKELDYNKLQLGSDVRYPLNLIISFSIIKFNDSQYQPIDILKSIEDEITNKENIGILGVGEQGIQGECLNQTGKLLNSLKLLRNLNNLTVDLDNTFSSWGSLWDVNDSTLWAKKVTSIKSKGIKDLFTQNSIKSKPVVFVNIQEKNK